MNKLVLHFSTLVFGLPLLPFQQDPGIGSNDSIIQEIQRDWPAYNMTATGYEADIFVKAADNSTLVGEVTNNFHLKLQ